MQKFMLPLTVVPIKTDAGWHACCEIAQARMCLITKTWVGIRLMADSNGGFRTLVRGYVDG